MLGTAYMTDMDYLHVSLRILTLVYEANSTII